MAADGEACAEEADMGLLLQAVEAAAALAESGDEGLRALHAARGTADVVRCVCLLERGRAEVPLREDVDDLADDEAMIITVPRCDDCTYQGAQIGSDWYASTDYETHQTSLTKAQAATDPDGKLRFVVSERAPGGDVLDGPLALRLDALADL